MEEKNYYQELNKALLSYEENQTCHTFDIYWICDRIAWCNDWHKLTPEQNKDVVERAEKILFSIASKRRKVDED